MIEWMRDVLWVFQSPDETFFQAVTIMDLYFAKSKPLAQKELHEIGVACMFISSKFSELEPLTIDLMIKKASHNKIARESLLTRERKILNTISFKVAIPSLKDHVEILVQNLPIDMKSPEIFQSLNILMYKAIMDAKCAFGRKPSQVAYAIIF